MPRLTLLGIVVGHCLLCSGQPAPADEGIAFFETKIRPVLVKHCYECHSADSDEVGGKLRLDSRDGLLSGGESGPAMVAGQPDSSLLIQAMRYDGMEMPPDGRLPDTVINDFVQWIESGATDPRVGQPQARDEGASSIADQRLEDAREFWSFVPRGTPAVPEVNRQDWPRNSIDRFVLAGIESAQLKPAGDADARTLIRRLHFDLIGLPPSYQEVNDFEAAYDRDPRGAVESLVNRLLASPQFGVRWGRHWLDVARYGESNGDDGLGRNASFPHAWRYRDYVIDAFNEDIPYDRFLTEQIAGDLLPAETAAERNRLLTATGFLAIGSKPAVAMNANFAMDVVDDQINVIGTTVMGLSVACARCHDHKHDPIPTRDYYALAGIFSSTETLYGAAGNEKLTAPPTPLHELTDRLPQPAEPMPDRTATPQLPDLYSSHLAQLNPALHAVLNEAPGDLTVEPPAAYDGETFASVKETTFKGQFAEAAPSYAVSFWFRNQLKNDARPITAYLFSRARLGDQKLPGDHLGIGGNHEGERTGKLFVFNGNEGKQTIGGSTVIPVDTWNHVTLVRDGKRVKVFLNGQLEIDGELPPMFGDSTEYCIANRSDNFAPLNGNLGHLAIFPRALSDQESIAIHEASGQPRGPQPIPVKGFAMGVRDQAKPTNCKIHINGEGKNLGPEVPRGFLTAYQQIGPPKDSDFSAIKIDPQRSGRLELARWLTHPDHPQTARVIVNRVWLHLFGQGMVATPDDFGVYGARPTHPDLLDHLANGLVQDGWSIKRLIRRIVLSRTYQLDSHDDPSQLESDPTNRWLARHNRRRLDAESLRDSILRSTGTLDASPRQGSDISELDVLINWPPGESTNLHRENHHRSVYLCMLRHAPPKELAAFDLPDGVQVMGNRETTTLPTQALFLMNSDFVVDQASALADRILAQADRSEPDKIQEIFRRVLHRDPRLDESTRTIDYLQSMRASLTDEITDPQRREQRSWASLCQALLTTNEFRYVD